MAREGHRGDGTYDGWVSQRLARALAALALVAAAAAVVLVAAPQDEARPIIFVHGMGGDAREIGTRQFPELLGELASRYPRADGCQRDAQPDRPWEGSPCVFRYADDIATGGDSRSGVESNADKLADEVAGIAARTEDRVVLIGFSMGGAIVRAYLALHPEEAARHVAGVVWLDAAVGGSWLLAGSAAIEQFTDSPFGEALERVIAAVGGEVDRSPDAIEDLTPGSEVLRRISALPLPQELDYTTVYGDIRLRVDVPGPGAVRLPSIGDVILLPGDPAPGSVPVLGGQRLAPTADTIEIRHGDEVSVGLETLRDLSAACLSPLPPSCRQGVREAFDSPSAHWRVPESLGTIRTSHPELGEGTLLDLIVRAVGRSTTA